jgi:molecular chaperone GrpE
MSPRNAISKPKKTMNPEDQNPQVPLQSPVENGTAKIDVGLGGDAARIAELEAKVAELTDAHLRAKAETENARRRADDEVAKARKYAVEAFADSLLPVKDSLEAAIATPDAAVEQVLEGVHATLRQLVSALERNKVSQISPPAGTRFDPHQHQAISMVPADQESNTIVTVLQKGYLIADRVLRPALVTVAAPK